MVDQRGGSSLGLQRLQSTTRQQIRHVQRQKHQLMSNSDIYSFMMKVRGVAVSSVKIRKQQINSKFVWTIQNLDRKTVFQIGID